MAFMRSVGVRLRMWTDQYKRDAREAARATKDIGDAGKKAKADLHGLGDEMTVAGSKLKKVSREIRQELASGASSLGGTLADAGIKPWAIGAAVAAAAPALPALAAAVSGAVVGGVGLGGIAGGIVAASKDPAVKAAGRSFADTWKREFFAAGEEFVSPTVKLLHTLEDAIEDLDIAGMLAPAAEHMDELADGAAGFVGELGDGLRGAIANSGPFLDIIGNRLPGIGAALGGMLEQLSENENAAVALDDVLQGLKGTIVLTGDVLDNLADGYDEVKGFTQEWGKELEILTNILSPLTLTVPVLAEALGGSNRAFIATKDGMEEAGDEAVVLGGNLAGAAAEAAALRSAFDHLNAELMVDWRASERNAEQAVDDLTAALEESNGSLDVHEQEGRDAAAAVDALALAAADAAQAKFEETHSVEQANAVYEDYIGQLRQTLINAGYATDEVDALIASISATPTYKAIQFDVGVRMSGWADFSGLRNQLAGLIASVFSFRHGGIIQHAQSGLLREATIATKPMVSWAEPETEREAFVPKRGNYSRSMGILSEAAGWYNADVVPRGTWAGGGGSGSPMAVNVIVSAAPGFGGAVLDGLRFETEMVGAGSVQRHAGQRGRYGG